ncbi:MAG TPA: 50S ribosomal protein L30 [Pyrinomonadaceae bacterium]|nr:50S ribosomal protein L30 [Pyrinomonadaceae bacterium]
MESLNRLPRAIYFHHLRFIDFEGAMAEKRTKKSEQAKTGKIRIQYYRSFIATPKTHKQMVRSLGLTKLNQIVERPDNASMRGAVAKIPHLLRIVE